MIPIKYFWSEHPDDNELNEALKIVETEDCVVIIRWSVFRSTYQLTVRRGMSFEDCKKQIPTVYGL